MISTISTVAAEEAALILKSSGGSSRNNIPLEVKNCLMIIEASKKKPKTSDLEHLARLFFFDDENDIVKISNYYQHFARSSDGKYYPYGPLFQHIKQENKEEK